jgi:ligand-binding sensor domain-containing protein
MTGKFRGTGPLTSRVLLVSALLTLFFAVPIIHSQENRMRFEELSIEDGLSQTIVLSIAQDNDGFIWFATEDGLNRYDGYHFSVIKHDPDDSRSMAYNHLLSLFIDSRGISF